MRGYCGIGIWHTKTKVNVGTLWRSADAFGADFLFTVGKHYENQASDTTKAYRHTPLFHFADLDDLIAHAPRDCPIVGVEFDPCAHHLANYVHPERACYLLGAEDHGLSPAALSRCHQLVQIPSLRCLNVATAGSIVLYDRALKHHARETIAA